MGGAAGHMSHPFDLEWVDSGTDLIDFFNRVKTLVEKENAASVKIDGVNVSFKLVSTDDGGREFAVDRGSMKEIDINGITDDRVDERFPEGHGMRPAIKTLLAILNTALPDIRNELKALGMWDDPSKFLNTEYVSGTTNVTAYEDNFLAIHGLNQFYQRVAKRGASKGNVRTGLERPEGDKSPSTEIPYNDDVMENLINKIGEQAKPFGFLVYGSVPTSYKGEIDFASTLGEDFVVRISDEKEISKPLSNWLASIKNPRYSTVTLKNGKKAHPLHRSLYKAVLEQIPLVDLVDEEYAEDVIAGAVIMHATRMLGNDVLNSLTSPMGDVTSHEGVVLRDEELFGINPVKITGEFILGGMASAFQKDAAITEEEGEELIPRKEVVALIPGAFKPPHKGHADMVLKYLEGDGVPKVDKVVVLISAPLKNARKLKNGREITATDSERIWKEVLLPNVDEESLEILISDMASPISAAYKYFDKNSDVEPSLTTVILGASNKPDKNGLPDWHRWNNAEKYAKEGLTVLYGDEYAAGCTQRSCGIPYSATVMRELISNLIEDPNDDESYRQLSEFIPEEKIPYMFSILDIEPPTAPIELPSVEEMSSMGGGAVAGYSAPQKENEDEMIIREVMKLIMERGILK